MSDVTPSPHAFPPGRRLKTPGEFRRVQTDGKSFDLGPIVVRVRVRPPPAEPKPGRRPPRETPPGGRLGLAVSRRAGNAVQRNRVKRLVREVFRQRQHALVGLDLVVTARPGASDLGFDAVAKLFDDLQRRLAAGRR